tara:strand:+ start:1172 stop:1714 length:543 start_codon:yes stop_codon:yes gene_type:complete
MATLTNNPNGSLENVLPQLPPEPEQDLSIQPLPEVEEELEPKDIFIDKAKSIIKKNIKTTIEPVEEEEKPKRKRRPYKPRKKKEKKVVEPVKNVVETVHKRPHPKVVKKEVQKPFNDGKKRYTMDEFFGFMEAYDRFNKSKTTKQEIKQKQTKPNKSTPKPKQPTAWKPMVLGNKQFFNI